MFSPTHPHRPIQGFYPVLFVICYLVLFVIVCCLLCKLLL